MGRGCSVEILLSVIIVAVLNCSTNVSKSLPLAEDSTKPYLILVTASGRNVTVHKRTENLQEESYFNALDPISSAVVHGL